MWCLQTVLKHALIPSFIWLLSSSWSPLLCQNLNGQPWNNKLVGGTVAPIRGLFGCNVPPNDGLLRVTVPPNSGLFDLLYLQIVDNLELLYLQIVDYLEVQYLQIVAYLEVLYLQIVAYLEVLYLQIASPLFLRPELWRFRLPTCLLHRKIVRKTQMC